MVDGTALESPYVLRAIGEAETLATAMGIPGGVIDSFASDGVSATVVAAARGRRRRLAGAQRRLSTLARPTRAREGATPVSTDASSEANYPPELRYTAEHEWVGPADDDGVVRIGVTDYAQAALGDIVFVSLPAVGDEVTAGAACGELESTKSVSDIYAPLDGVVVARNDALDANPELSTPMRTARAGCSPSARPTPTRARGLLDDAAYRGVVGDG